MKKILVLALLFYSSQSSGCYALGDFLSCTKSGYCVARQNLYPVLRQSMATNKGQAVMARSTGQSAMVNWAANKCNQPGRRECLDRALLIELKK